MTYHFLKIVPFAPRLVHAPEILVGFVVSQHPMFKKQVLACS
jgi:hypothetical protein